MRYKKVSGLVITGALIASSVAATFGADYKTSIRLVLSGGSASTADVYDEAYTLVLPEALTITQEGWNSIGNMTASYGGTNDGFDPSKKLVVTAASTTGFNLTASGISDTIGYTVRTSENDKEATTTFEFTAAEITKAGTSKPIGVYVGSFSGKRNATYSDTITYTAVVQEGITWNEVNISSLKEYTAQNGDVLMGLAGSDVHITVPDGATIRLKEAMIIGITGDYSHKWAGITCAGDATIILEGNNEVKGGHENYPGIYVPENATLTIKGSGSLTTASHKGRGAGIGGGYKIACGNIVIEGGNITARGGISAAGIGGGAEASCGNITITDGVTSVTATKGEDAPNSIGAGKNGTCGTVTIAEGAKAKVTQN